MHIARTLQELPLYETVFERHNPFSWNACPAGDICTENVIDDSNMCFQDEGGPLYGIGCSTERGFILQPSCLYGVASYFFSYNKISTEKEASMGNSFEGVEFTQPGNLARSASHSSDSPHSGLSSQSGQHSKRSHSPHSSHSSRSPSPFSSSSSYSVGSSSRSGSDSPKPPASLEKCNDGSAFARVSPHIKWIRDVMSKN